jgi:hypothetical protein
MQPQGCFRDNGPSGPFFMGRVPDAYQRAVRPALSDTL